MTFDWKTLGIETKVIELIENTTPEAWDEERMQRIAKTVSIILY